LLTIIVVWGNTYYATFWQPLYQQRVDISRGGYQFVQIVKQIILLILLPMQLKFLRIFYLLNISVEQRIKFNPFWVPARIGKLSIFQNTSRYGRALCGALRLRPSECVNAMNYR
jgi:hypothetical protein